MILGLVFGPVPDPVYPKRVLIIDGREVYYPVPPEDPGYERPVRPVAVVTGAK